MKELNIEVTKAHRALIQASNHLIRFLLEKQWGITSFAFADTVPHETFERVFYWVKTKEGLEYWLILHFEDNFAEALLCSTKDTDRVIKRIDI